MSKELKIDRGDLVLMAVAVLGVLIVGVSIYWLFTAPVSGGKDQVDAYMSAYEIVVKGTLLSLFTTIVTARLAYAAAVYVLNKFADK